MEKVAAVPIQQAIRCKTKYNEMTFCNNIDEMGTDYPCHTYGLQFNYELENQMKLAKNNDYSASICCK